MRKFAICLPILALSACSALEQPYLPSGDSGDYGHYAQGCAVVSCAPGQSYSVANTFDAHHVGSGAEGDYWPDTGFIPSYENGGAAHVNPVGYAHQGHSAHNGQFGGQYGYGQPLQLRGLYGQKQGHFYGTLGGVMYDTDLESFGLQGRAGYDSGRGFLGATFGAELEASVGLTDEAQEDLAGFTDVTSGFDNNIGAFVLARLPVTERISLHSRLGYNFQKFTVQGADIDGNSVKDSLTADGVAIGFGAEYAISPRSGLRIDYTESDTEFGGALSGVSASFTRKF